MESEAEFERHKAAWAALAGLMRSLKLSEGWAEYQKQLEDMENRALQAMVAGTKDDFDYQKGFIAGIRACFHLPQSIIDQSAKL